MYNYQVLKAKKLKSKLEWLLVRDVVDHESVVQKHRIKTLQRHRQTLEQKWLRSLLTRETAELVTEITQELQSWQAESTQILNGNRLKGKIWCQVGVFCQFPLSRHFCYRPPHWLPPCQHKIESAKVLTTKPIIFRLATGLTWVWWAVYHHACPIWKVLW